VVRLDARTDFRLEKLAGAPVWYVPADRAAEVALDEAWRRLTSGHAGAELHLTVQGRTVCVPCATMGVARFSFHDLCGAPLAAARPRPCGGAGVGGRAGGDLTCNPRHPR